MKKYVDEEMLNNLITQIENMYYKAGDVKNIRYQVARFITTGGKSLRLTIPLNNLMEII